MLKKKETEDQRISISSFLLRKKQRINRSVSHRYDRHIKGFDRLLLYASILIFIQLIVTVSILAI